MAKSPNLKPGDRTPKSGQYPVVGPRGAQDWQGGHVRRGKAVTADPEAW